MDSHERAKISNLALTPPQSKKKQTTEKPRKTKTTTPLPEKKTKRQDKQKETEKPEKQPARKGKHSTSTLASPSHPRDEAKEDWFDSAGQETSGRHAVRSK